MKETAITASHISKEYTLDYSRTNSFKELLTRRILRKHKLRVDGCKKVQALQDISFEVNKGEALGIIGKNGAGKSTLLKVLSGITKPTLGQIEIFGRMSSILDIGVGFHPELSGRENVFLSGELNGLSRKDIKGRLDEIIDFSGVEKFIDTPVKYYSSGMFLRLAFSVFTGIDSEILLLDEVMSVGDAEFQMRSYKKLQSMFGQGKTIVLVSHNPSDIVKLCSRVLVLDQGKIINEGSPAKILSYYFEKSLKESLRENPDNSRDDVSTDGFSSFKKRQNQHIEWDDPRDAPGNELIKLLKARIQATGKSPDEPMMIDDILKIEIDYLKGGDDDYYDVGIMIFNFGNIVFASKSIFDLSGTLRDKSSGYFTATTEIPGNLLNDSVYSLGIHFVRNGGELSLHLQDVLYFKMHQPPDPLLESLRIHFNEYPGSVRPKLEWRIIKR